MTTIDTRDGDATGRRSDHAGRDARTSGPYVGPARIVRLVALLTTAAVVLAGCPVVERFAASAAITFPEFSAAGAERLGGSLTAAKPPGRVRIELGRSVNGIPLTIEVLGTGPETILIVGGIHGDEPSGAEVASTLASFLRSHPECLTGRTVGILARANPDGLLSGTRANARGVDLNRNFPSRDWRGAYEGGMYHGPAAASEPETLAAATAIEILRPRRVIDIHSIDGGRHCNNYDGSAEHLAKLMSRFNGYPALADVGYPTPGALGCWAGIDLGIPAVTLELPRALSAEQCWRDNAAALLAFINDGDDRVAQEAHALAGSP